MVNSVLAALLQALLYARLLFVALFASSDTDDDSNYAVVPLNVGVPTIHQSSESG